MRSMVRVYSITPQSQFKNNSRAAVPLRFGHRTEHQKGEVNIERREENKNSATDQGRRY